MKPILYTADWGFNNNTKYSCTNRIIFKAKNQYTYAQYCDQGLKCIVIAYDNVVRIVTLYYVKSKYKLGNNIVECKKSLNGVKKCFKNGSRLYYFRSLSTIQLLNIRIWI